MLEDTNPTATIWFVSWSAFRLFETRCDALGGALAASRSATTRVVPGSENIVERMGLTQYSAP